MNGERGTCQHEFCIHNCKEYFSGNNFCAEMFVCDDCKWKKDRGKEWNRYERETEIIMYRDV